MHIHATPTRTAIAARAAFALFCALALAGCGFGLGPTKLPGSRMDYNLSVQRSSNEELLLNLVRLKYFDQPVFLQVGSIASVFSYGVTAGVNATLPDQRNFPQGVYSTYTPSFSATYSDSPTVTYTPYQGQTYAQQFLAELDFDRFTLLYRSGWDIEYLMRVLVTRIGRIEHSYDARRGFTSESHREFLEITKIFTDMDDANNFDIVAVSQKDAKGVEEKYTVIQLRFDTGAEADRVEKLLGVKLKRVPHDSGKITAKLRLAPVTDFHEHSRNGHADDHPELPFRLRNCLRALDTLAQGVEVPDMLAVKRQGFNFRDQTRDIMDVRASAARPEDAFVSVRYGSFWYFIGQGDDRSKEVFQMMHAIFGLQSGDLPKNAPILTLPVTGGGG